MKRYSKTVYQGRRLRRMVAMAQNLANVQVSNSARSSMRTVVGEDWAPVVVVVSAGVGGGDWFGSSWSTPIASVVPLEPVGQHGGGGLPREPWIGPFEPERQTFTISLPSPRRTPQLGWSKGGGDGGSDACPLRQVGYFEEGRQGVRACHRRWAAQDRGDSHDVELDDEPNPFAA
jgi:hypothetical protein